MRDQVDLGEARNLHIPVIRLEGDVMLQQGSRLGAAIEPAPQLPLVRGQPVIDRASADAEQLTLGLRGEPEAPANPGHPLGQQRFQPRRPRIVGSLPDRLQNGNHPRTVGRRPGSPLPPSASRPAADYSTGESRACDDNCSWHKTRPGCAASPPRAPSGTRDKFFSSTPFSKTDSSGYPSP